MAKTKQKKDRHEDVLAQIAEQVMEQDDAPVSDDDAEEVIVEEELLEETVADAETEAAEDENAVDAVEEAEELAITQDDVRLVEAILFATPTALTVAQIAERFPEDRVSLIPDVLEILKEQYAIRGVNLVQREKRWAFRTATELGDNLRLEKEQTKKFTRAAMETMAIIAYHQPVTRAEIENIRGVATSPGALDALMEAGWIKPGKRREVPGRPVTWLSTQSFLDHFGLEKLGDLPGMDELKAAGLLDKRPAIEAMPTADLFGDDENKDDVEDPQEVTDEDLMGKTDDENADADFDDEDEADGFDDTEMSAGGDEDDDDEDADAEEDDSDADHDDFDDEVKREFDEELDDETGEDDDFDDDDDYEDDEEDEDDDRE
jgi:segregation and condensation protein B